MTAVLPRASVVWVGILAVAIANGALREALFIPRLGAATGHVMSTLILASAVLLVASLTIGWVRPASVGDSWWIGTYWVVLVLAFEFLAGHYLFGRSWQTLLADYRVDQGRIWILVLITTLASPRIAMWRAG